MHRALRTLIVSCAVAASLAAASAFAGSFDVTVYGSVVDPQRGFDYMRVIPGRVVIARMDHALLAGAFANGDYSTEYAIDDTATLVEIDTATGAVSPIGELAGLEDAAHIGLAIDPTTSEAYVLVAWSPCTDTNLYGVDLVTGATMLIGGVPGCMQSPVFAPDGTLYALDRDTDYLVSLTNGLVEIGSVGFPLDDADVLTYPPGYDVLFLWAFNPIVETNMLYSVDVGTGSATLIGEVGGQDPIAAMAVGGPLPDSVFANGFDP
ncbi:MAG TPA: hypothetical protein VFL30_10690 [Rhodanobacteraceae bacterium]|nr:hypothetical protein [Rhodanobacteraceae bacterium]